MQAVTNFQLRSAGMYIPQELGEVLSQPPTGFGAIPFRSEYRVRDAWEIGLFIAPPRRTY